VSKVDLTIETKNIECYRYGQSRSLKRITDRSFVIIWQTSNSLEDVRDALNKAGVTSAYCNEPFTLAGLKSKAGRMRVSYDIRLKPLASASEPAYKVPKWLQRAHDISELRKLAAALAS